ncbi:MAG: membrane dipeptidase [Cytophagaceae bacterium]|nr:membrane dipeptidase [Gemmatimonadaceae bacterium]
MSHDLSRRDFTRQAALGAVAASFSPRFPGLPDAAVREAWPGYDRAYVLDMLATAGPFNVPDMFTNPLTPAMVENARRSGITAVNSTISGFGNSPEAIHEQTIDNIAAWHHELVAHPDVFVQVRSIADIRRAKAEKKVGVIFGFQDTTPYWDRIGRIETFHRLGVRIVQLTYNGSNLVGDGCLVPEDRGLKPYGREVLAQLNAKRTLVDLSHVGWETTRQVIDASNAPVAATHSGSAAVNNVPRNKPDDILRKLAAKGGVVGVYMMPFLTPRGQPTAEDFMRHLAACINTCGEDHVGIGTDLSITPLDLTPEFRAVHAGFVRQRRAAGISAPGEAEDVFNYVPDFNNPRRMDLVADAMARAGHSSARIEKVLGANWMRLLTDVWG